MLKKFIFNRYISLLNFLHLPIMWRNHRDLYHILFDKFKDQINMRERSLILEIGSRSVTGNIMRGHFPHCTEYVGLDILPGENVDKVGDVHELSSILPKGHFDAVFSMSVFEHLLMPWKAVLEINSVMKEGGLLFIATHPTWPPHELPWDFWRYQKNSFYALLNSFTGFELIDVAEGIPCLTYALVNECGAKDVFRFPSPLGVAALARKISQPDKKLQWDVPLTYIIDTMYPSRANNQAS